MDDLNTAVGTHLSPLDADVMRRTAKWARFLAIVGFVMIALMVIIGLFAGSLIGWFIARESALTGMAGMPMQGAMGALGAVYMVMFILIALLYFFPTLWLYRFATHTLKAVNGAFDGTAFTGGIDSLRKLFAFMGVLTIIVLCLYAIGFLFMGLGMMMMH